jgi:YD repeat-containing protein
MDRPTATTTPPHASELRKTTFGYDSAGRLARVTLPKGVATTANNDFTTEYGYDPLARVVTAQLQQPTAYLAASSLACE